MCTLLLLLKEKFNCTIKGKLFIKEKKRKYFEFHKVIKFNSGACVTVSVVRGLAEGKKSGAFFRLVSLEYFFK